MAAVVMMADTGCGPGALPWLSLRPIFVLSGKLELESAIVIGAFIGVC
jgi:hypothetical protein